MWIAGIDWDDMLPEDVTLQARDWLKELGNLNCIKVPRCIQLGQEHVVSQESIHTFVDASQGAYGACVYARYVYIDASVSVRLIAAKTRVAPVATMSIPRLELMGAILGLQLTLTVVDILQVPITEVEFWSDSMNVLWWIRGRGRQFEPFVANRIGEIQRHTSPEQWQYVSTYTNPADLLTRGVKVEKLVEDHLWWNGPKFVMECKVTWPKKEIVKGPEIETETKKAYQEFTMLTVSSKKAESDCIEPSVYSSWQKLVRVQAWLVRFVENCQVKKAERVQGELSVDEIEAAEMYIIRQTQREFLTQEYISLASSKEVPGDSKILTLNPKLDEDGIMRCDSRLVNAEFVAFDVRFPIILPRKSWVTKLIVKHYHAKGKHIAGTNQTLSALSTRFWVIAGREAIRDWERECAECRKRKAKPATQIMAPLPNTRLKMPLKAFSHVGIDFGGPFLTVQGRGRSRQKRYLCLFTCMATRAVHLEVAFGLDTDSFLIAFYRMASRRGLPQEVTSDNGTNFIGASRELKELVAQLDKQMIDQSTANKGVKWHVNPPLAPHFGGVHEVMIRAAKRAIYAILSEAEVKDEELITAVTGAEGLINSRPLTYQSANPADNVPLTPNHFHHGQLGGEFAPQSVDSTGFNLKKRWRRIQELVRNFWQRWMQEWISGLSPRKKWWKPQRDLRVGDVVLVASSDTPRGHWPLGRVTAVHKGDDGHVRVVKLQVGQNEMLRPITKVCPLEFGCDGLEEW